MAILQYFKDFLANLQAATLIGIYFCELGANL